MVEQRGPNRLDKTRIIEKHLKVRLAVIAFRNLAARETKVAMSRLHEKVRRVLGLFFVLGMMRTFRARLSVEIVPS